jgi:hypothetical protein
MDGGSERSAILGPRWRFLARTSGLLDRSLDYEETLANVVRFVVPRMADFAVIALLAVDGTHLTILRNLSATSIIIVPLTARGLTPGALLLATSHDFSPLYD